eukprot:1451383-Rhodomonas_salina.1
MSWGLWSTVGTVRYTSGTDLGFGVQFGVEIGGWSDRTGACLCEVPYSPTRSLCEVPYSHTLRPPIPLPYCMALYPTTLWCCPTGTAIYHCRVPFSSPATR